MPLESLRRSLTALLGGVRVGESLSGWQLRHVDVDESMAFAFERAGERVEIALSPRDASVPHYAQTASFNVAYSASRLPGTTLGPEARALIDVVCGLLRAHDTGAALRRLTTVVEAPKQGEVREIEVQTLLCPVTIGGESYYTANPYVGCLIGCSFCYAQPRVAVIRRMAGFPDLPWGRYVTVKTNAARVLDQELAAMEPRPVVLSPLVSDVYQPVERAKRVTRGILEVLARRGVQVYVLTRATLVLRDLDLFRQIPEATVGFSVPTDDDDVGRAYEPRAALVSERLTALGKLRSAGIRTVAVVQPLLYMDVENLVARLTDVCELLRVDVHRPPALGGAPLRSSNPDAPPPPEDQRRLRETIIEAAERRGLRLWTSHVPM